MKRKVIKIDEKKCTGCGLCVPECHEEAIKIINGKAKLIKDAFCDGLGACLGECPEGALSIEEREAESFDEKLAQETIACRKKKDVFSRKGQSAPQNLHVMSPAGCCPGSAHAIFEGKPQASASELPACTQPSELSHWPVQMHLINPAADFLHGKDLLLAADCVAFALGDFHARFLKGRTLAIACPKLDEGQKEYIEKVRRMADEAKINTLTVIIMQVPCCRGLIQIARAGLNKATRKVPLKAVIVSIKGDVLSEEWI
ncbi:MAG: 4Fe-4S binding protein [Smithella sp.]|jgi:Pyruvate/2-oxoacid:ferredoxin oxidoreductase delta subunit